VGIYFKTIHMEELIFDIEEVLDDLRHLLELDDDTIDSEKLDRHIRTLEKTLEKIEHTKL
jgi:uncharacterized protein YPO0396